MSHIMRLPLKRKTDKDDPDIQFYASNSRKMPFLFLFFFLITYDWNIFKEV